jgi:hypothetical protein
MYLSIRARRGLRVSCGSAGLDGYWTLRRTEDDYYVARITVYHPGLGGLS